MKLKITRSLGREFDQDWQEGQLVECEDHTLGKVLVDRALAEDLSPPAPTPTKQPTAQKKVTVEKATDDLKEYKAKTARKKAPEKPKSEAAPAAAGKSETQLTKE